MNKELLHSREYKDLFGTPWEVRHNEEMQKKFGVWRWAGMIENRDMIIDLIENTLAIDFGGAKGPLGFSSLIVDQDNADVNGFVVGWKSFSGLHDCVFDVIFTSHTLEHIYDIRAIIHVMHEKLTKTGKAIIHVPSIRGAKYWHPSVKKEHKWIFRLKDDIVADQSIPVDLLFEQEGFEINFCEHVGDCSILMIASKK